MRNTTKLILIMLFSFLFQKASAKEHSAAEIIRYYDLTNKAELEICNGKTQAALAFYDTAYKMMDTKMFFRHYYNYFIASVEVNDFDKAGELLFILKQQGFKEENYKDLMKLYYDSEKQKKLIDLYANTKVTAQLDLAYLHKIDSMHNIDQKVNNHFRSINNGLLDDFGHDTLNKIIESNLRYMSILFRDKFPIDALLGRDSGPAFHCKYHLMLIHNIMIATFRDKGWGNYHYLDSIFYQGVLRGEFDPVDFEAYISSPIGYEGSDTIRYLGKGKQIITSLSAYDFSLIKDSLFEFIIPTDRVALVAPRRKNVLGIAKSEDFKKKLIYQYYYPRYNFIPKEYISDLGKEEMPASVKAKFFYVPKPQL